MALGSAGPTSQSPICEYAWLGRVEYADARALQQRLARERAFGQRPDSILLLEHPPVYTTGRRGTNSNLRTTPKGLGAPLVETDRGGDITFHGPGQLVSYPTIDLRAARLSVVDYVRGLEEVVIRTIRGYSISGAIECGLTGVWVGDEKIAAIGVRVSRPGGAKGGWITTHGLSLNVNVDLTWFGRIVPCGIADREMTSMERELGAAPPIEDVALALVAEFGRVFGRAMVPTFVRQPSIVV